jgi:hypothetical protein
MGIAISVGLLSLLGLGAVLLTPSVGGVSGSVSDTEKIFEESQKLRDSLGLDNESATEPPISSSESSRPNNPNNNGKINWTPFKIGSVLGGIGGYKVGYKVGDTLGDVGEGDKSFNWGLVLGLVGGAFIVRKIFK